MMGIYCFTNKVNGKKYVGQSLSIESRFNSHRNCHLNERYNGYDTKFYRALRKYGFDNFDFCVLEECSKEELNNREKYYISHFDSFNSGYNSSDGGETVGNGSGENHHQAILAEVQILEIKELLREGGKTQKSIAELYDTTQSNISQINLGRRWAGVGDYSYPIVCGKHKPKSGETNGASILTDKEVLSIRQRYEKETGRQIFETYKDRMSYTSFERALTGRTYKNLPIYKKKQKIWIEPVSTILG